MSRFLIGIDLGTTNSAVGFIDLKSVGKAPTPTIQTFPIPQLVAPAQTAARPLLPSFLYVPGQYDLPAGATALPWSKDNASIVGEFARSHGAKVPGRLVTSAKSWLCHAGVDRTSPLLPWNAPPDVARLSPLEVSTQYLKHMVDAWNAAPGRTAADDLREQQIVLTVPASFDDVARNLTVQAARDAGMKNVTLLEEPQAAFYCWLGMSAAAESQKLKPGMVCLVVDVGGGTSDFSLIRAAEAQGEMTFVRESVGDHLLLGGDNMDLALARYAEGKFGDKAKLDAAGFGLLVQSCRQAKEVLLGDNPPESCPITVMGRGRSVLAGTMHTTLTAQEVRDVILDGFFPIIGGDGEAPKASRTALQEMGLPYVADPAISRHLKAFLDRQAVPGESVSGPEAILFNGGVFQPLSLRNRLLDVVSPWFEGSWKPLVLTNPSLDLAVAWGATWLAWLKHSGGRRIGGGIARSYYVGVETSSPSPEGTSVVCVVPRHLEEGTEVDIPKPVLELALGEPAQFPLYTSTVRDDAAGDLLTIRGEQLKVLPPLHTLLRGGKRAGTKRVPVHLAAKSTEIGTLEIYCVANEGDNRWRLEFNVRDIVPDAAASGATAETVVQDIWPEALVQGAAAAIRGVYTPTGGDDPKELTKRLETALEAARPDWPTSLCRRLWTELQEASTTRQRSASHLSRWYNLVGFCLRPGFGDPLDRYRIEGLWKLLATPQKLTSGIMMTAMEGGADYWIMWRRCCGGLNAPLQMSLWNRLKSMLIPGGNRPAVRLAANETSEMWRLAASLERLDGKTREFMGKQVLALITKKVLPPHAFWCLGRLGSRSLLYGPLNNILHPDVVSSWMKELNEFLPQSDDEKKQYHFCLSQIARRTGNRAIDLDEDDLAQIAKTLRAGNAPEELIRPVEEVVEVAESERQRQFGDSLPIGLRIAGG